MRDYASSLGPSTVPASLAKVPLECDGGPCTVSHHALGIVLQWPGQRVTPLAALSDSLERGSNCFPMPSKWLEPLIILSSGNHDETVSRTRSEERHLCTVQWRPRLTGIDALSARGDGAPALAASKPKASAGSRGGPSYAALHIHIWMPRLRLRNGKRVRPAVSRTRLQTCGWWRRDACSPTFG
jgi:hypothetical protein